MANAETIELIAAPSSPNLYLGDCRIASGPFIDLTPSVRVEMGLALRTFPFLIDPEQAEHSPQEWARLITAGVLEAHNRPGERRPSVE